MSFGAKKGVAGGDGFGIGPGRRSGQSSSTGNTKVVGKGPTEKVGGKAEGFGSPRVVAKSSPKQNTNVAGRREAPAEKKVALAEEELSNRAKFRLTPVDPNTLFKIKQQNLCSPMGRAMRVANRDAAQREQIEQEKQFRGFSRPPLFKDISPQLMDFIGESRRNKLTFLAGAMATESFPPDGGLPEVAICGRSNVGKSSIINAVTLSTVARSSDKPGMTQQFNFYLLPRRLTLVDLPGYGFAFADPHKMETWRLLMDAYMSTRRSLKRALLVVDARHGLKANDVEFMARLERARTPFQVVMTKCDLTREEDLARRHAHVAQELRAFSRAVGPIRLVSAYTGAGLADLAQDLLSLSVRPPPRAAPAEPERGGGEEEEEEEAGGGSDAGTKTASTTATWLSMRWNCPCALVR
jgi:GTP-binding protein